MSEVFHRVKRAFHVYPPITAGAAGVTNCVCGTRLAPTDQIVLSLRWGEEMIVLNCPTCRGRARVPLAEVKARYAPEVAGGVAR